MSELQRIKPIFEQALDREGCDRRAYLDEVCGNEPELMRKVEALLKAHEHAEGFLEAPVLGEDVSPVESPLSEGPGTIIGRYKLLEKIGEGGMAVVYMAEQTEPIRRKVALKIIKLGMDTKQVIARFEAERQALAMMDHPNIAKVLDAGATETGRPYFVMELVTGVSITEYCDKNNLCTKDRLALFMQVCNAVQHAHTKGIIHRDIKPSNVMVTHHDGKPIPKVIDFGIAKATNQRLTEKTLFTRYAHIIGTPAYMSPEQAELSDLDIDTRTDIYSLGVLLYELLTGATPFSEDELRKAGYIEMQRVIREQEPVKPSTRLTTLGETLTDVAKHRSCTPDLLRKAVRGDLDWIVMKSLEKDRARRYETANNLAEDVRRHLEHEAVLARGPSTTYRLCRFLRRHRSQAIAALATVLVAGAGSVILSMWNQDRARLVEAEGFRHRGILSQAREQYARADRDIAIETIKPILQSKHVGSEAQLLRAGILADNRRFDEAVGVLKNLLNDQPVVAGAAHSLLARILWESESLNADKVKEIEEHRQKAEALLPETAEAYFLRAMTAITVKEQLASLDKALQLSPSHYESRRLRAYTYYASRKYNQLHDDALVMTILRPRDSLGYSLRAVARRELSRYQEAIADYDSAMALTAKDNPQYIDLSIQRCETLLRMGDYEQIIAEVPAGAPAYAGASLDPRRRVQDISPLRNHLFCALTAMGDYDKASALFGQIIRPGLEARTQFRNWCAKYVFDTLAAGRSWHPAGPAPTGAAFLPMVEAEETYRVLSARGRRITTDGFNAQWSPDGKKLAFSLGVQGRSGIAVFDPATRETDLLIVPGKYPRWSPDGRHIAFVRDRQFLSVPEFVAADLKNEPRPSTDEEVWLMRSDGTSPRRLARGVWPSWSQDSACVYYKSRLDNTLYSISITGQDSEPKRITPCPEGNPSVSPDNQRMACTDGMSLKVKDLASQTVAGKQPLPVPSGGWGASAWSPSGTELCLGGSGELENRTGLWIYRLDHAEPAKVLDGPITVGAWSPDGTRLVFELGAPHLEIWTADLDPSVSTVEALGPARTVEDHLRDVVAFHTRRIEADPLDAYAYSGRARCYDCLHDQANANADMRRWSAAASGRLPYDSRRVIDMPLNCELVFSAERPVNNMPILSVAFGQNGRCEMKLFEIPLVVTSLVGLGFLTGLDAPVARADFTFGTAVNLGPAVNSSATDLCPVISPDGLELYFLSGRPGGYGIEDIWVSRRGSAQDAWGPPVNLGPQVNTPGAVQEPKSMSADGLTLYFDSDRPGGYGGNDLYMTTRATKDSPWGPGVNLGPTVNTSVNIMPLISPDNLELYFASVRPGGFGVWDIWVSTRATPSDPWGPPVNLGPTVNTSATDGPGGVSPDGLTLFFNSKRPGGYGSIDVWMTTRPSKNSPWGPATNLGPFINTPYSDNFQSISFDGRWCYLDDCEAPRPGGCGENDLWQAPILPIVDFNGDGKVDAKDMDMLMADWGKSNSVCDIGPYPWGDGVVDEKDLGVLMESLVTPGPKASDVRRDMILSWARSTSVKYCDVYFGKSFDAVRDANRVDTKDVLVSYADTGTTYDPAGLLEYSTTYYWRVDFVGGTGPLPMIYKGPVIAFTTAAYSYPLKNVVATASSAQAGNGPEKTVDGSGLDKNDQHSTGTADMWLSSGAPPQWIQFAFDKVYAIDRMQVWNHNSGYENLIGFGAKTAGVEYSADGTTWILLAGVPEFARAPGQPSYVANTTVSFNGLSAKFVKLTITKNWGTVPATGLSEVRLFYIPEKSTAQP